MSDTSVAANEPTAASLSAAVERLASLRAAPAVAGHAPAIARLRDALRESAADVAIGAGDVTNVRLLAAAHALPLRVVASEWADPHGFSIGAWERPRRLLYPRARAVVCLHDDHVRFYRGMGVERVHAIAIPIVAAPSQARRPRERLIVALARLAWEKGLDLLVRAFARVAPLHPEWRLEIWGDGPMRAELERLIASLGMTGRVRLAGTTGDVYEPLARAELFALTSRTEGMPNALCEASHDGAVYADEAARRALRLVVNQVRRAPCRRRSRQ